MPAPKAYLAFDLGAESGRAVLARVQASILTIEEVARFPNTPVMRGESTCWDVSRLWFEMRTALSTLEEPRLSGIGVDTWGVDYALLGERGELLQDPYHYREPSNVAAMNEVLRQVPREEIYAITGIQFMPINTLNQLFALKSRRPRLLESASRLLMVPDLFNFWLTGRAQCEYTIASTSQMIDATSRRWAASLLERLELPAALPADLVEPGSVIGPLLPGISALDALTGTPVIASASHDTASAVAAIHARRDTAFLSSGTWSLLGIECDSPVLTPEALRLNFSNEGGVGRTTRLLKNVMGLWMLQSCRRSWAASGRDFTYGDLMDAAGREAGFQHLVDPDDTSFIRPDDMPRAIDRFCERTGQPRPASPGGYARTILDSLAMKYRLVVRNLESLTGNRIEQIRIVGGGSQNRLLNQFTADATGARVLAGPTEATALGNVAVQLLATGEVGSLAEARALVDRSFPTEAFEPRDVASWKDAAPRFRQYCELAYV
jgi:rhamnulokinase